MSAETLPDWMLALRPSLVRAAARLLRDLLLAEDATQDVYLHLLERPGLQPLTACYLFTAVRHRAIDLLRQRKGQRSLSVETLRSLCGWSPAAADKTPAEVAEVNDLLEAAERHLKAAERRDRARRPQLWNAWRLWCQGKPYADIASDLGVPEGTAKTWVWSARRVLEQ